MRAYLHCHLRHYPQGAQEYLHVGNMYFEHQQFEGALEYYQYAFGLDPENVEIQDKLRLTQQILEGTVQITSPEQHNMAALEQLHHELFRQYENEANLSEGFQQSLREIALLLQYQEEEIQQLACLA
jgi:tetratricopeptide (TPR) repeat protein